MKILVPLDGSSLSESVLRLAGQLARRWQGQILAVRVTKLSSLDPLPRTQAADRPRSGLSPDLHPAGGDPGKL